MSLHPADPFAELAARAAAPSPRVLKALREELSKDNAEKRLFSRSARVLWSAGALLLGLCLATLVKLHENHQTFFLTATAFSLSTAGLLLGGVVPSGRQLLGVSARRALLALLLAGLFTLLALRAESFLTFSEFSQSHSLSQAMTCAGHSLISGVIGAVALTLLWKRSDPFSPSLTGAFLGLFGGTLGTLSIGFLCKNHEGLHLTLGHGLSILLLTLVFSLIGRKWLSP